ncbi:ABC transporter ATP-binding protein [Brevibacillus reuszeri]|uniref:ABC transporter ATP-binding protein n=1 Tax=Brevibacillus reuszeri TaxID=54915 RepID=UPI003D24B28D
MRNWVWIWSHISKCRGLYFIAMLLWLLESVAYIATLTLQQQIIDEVIVKGQYPLFWRMLAMIAICYVVYSLLFVFSPYLLGIVHSFFRKRLTALALDHLYHIPIPQLHKERTGRYVELFSNEIPAVARLIGEDIADAFKYIFHALIVSIVIGTASPLILAGVLVFSIIFVKMGRTFGARQKIMAAQIQKEKTAVVICMEEGVASTREVVAFNREEWEYKRYSKVFDRYYKSVMAEGKMMVKQLLTKDPIIWGSYMMALAVGGYQVLQGELSVGFFVVIYQLTSELMIGIEKAYKFSVEVAGKMAFVDRVRNFLEDRTISDGTLPFKEPVTSLSCSQITFRYDGSNDSVLKGCNLAFPIGKKVALVGGSGSGKSTIAHLLIRFYSPDSGCILVNEKEIEQIKRGDWAKKVTIVFQEPYLFALTIRENVVMGVENVTQEQIEHVCRLMCIHDDIVNLPNGYDTTIGERGITLSGGQKQRLALARAILRNPEILILDEATSALDRHTERLIQRNMDEIRQGKTTIVIAHRLSTIKNADIVYVMKGGRVEEQGTHAELLQNNHVYKELVDAEVKLSNLSSGIGEIETA